MVQAEVDRYATALALRLDRPSGAPPPPPPPPGKCVGLSCRGKGPQYRHPASKQQHGFGQTNLIQCVIIWPNVC